MKRFKNILYFADGVTDSCPALERAITLAHSNQARLTVVDVVSGSSSSEDVDTRYGFDLNALIRERRQEQLEQLIAPLHDPNTLTYTQVYSGIPFVEVIRAIQRNGYDLLIKPARPPAGLSERLLGSADLHLLRKCPCPVWINRPGEHSPYRRILAAVDPMENESGGPEQLVLDLATSLAQRESAQLEVVHAWQLEGEEMLRSARSPLPQLEVNRLEEAERSKHDRALRRLLAPYKLKPAQVHLVKGTPAEMIRMQAQTLKADLIVMGTLGRTGIPGFFIGNTAEEILQSTRISILAVKPENFVSPVTG